MRHKNQSVSIEFEGGEAIATVKDGGPGGVDPGRLAKHQGLGLKGLRDRIESLGGKLEVDSKPGTYTRLTMHLKIADVGGGSRSDEQ